MIRRLALPLVLLAVAAPTATADTQAEKITKLQAQVRILAGQVQLLAAQDAVLLAKVEHAEAEAQLARRKAEEAWLLGAAAMPRACLTPDPSTFALSLSEACRVGPRQDAPEG